MRFINRTGTNTKLFAKNKLYVLQDIKKDKDGLAIYTFLVDDELKVVNFKSINQAETWLDSISI